MHVQGRLFIELCSLWALSSEGVPPSRTPHEMTGRGHSLCALPLAHWPLVACHPPCTVSFSTIAHFFLPTASTFVTEPTQHVRSSSHICYRGWEILWG
jgi:hypothetical protein